MNIRFFTAIAALCCVLTAACTPYNESRYRSPANDNRKKTVTSHDQQKIQEQRDQLKKNDERQEVEETTKKSAETGETTTAPVETSKPPVEEKRDYPTANKVPGKEGYVFSPYNNKIIDVQGMPKGTLVADPTYPVEAKKHFRVP